MIIKISFWQRIRTFFTGKVNVSKNIELDSQESTAKATTDTDSAKLLLMLLQKHGRLIDFVFEDIDSFTDEEVGAGVRVVHNGCRKVLTDHVELKPLLNQDEESNIVIEKDFNASEINLTGNIAGNPPFNGMLVHRGWTVKKIELPTVGESGNINVIFPAEVEL